MKDKGAAALLAFFLGIFGIHRFYLRQTGLGILYFFLSVTTISFFLSIIDFIVFLSMDRRTFDEKYNKDYLSDDRYSSYDRPDYRRRERSDRFRREQVRNYRDPEYRREERRRPPEPAPRPAPKPKKKSNPYRRSGIEKYKDYDYEGAINDFKKAIAIDPGDKASHFNIACAYSLNESPDEAFFHLSKAVEHGFVDFDRIRTHDALAFLRIQDEWDGFVKRGYRLQRAEGRKKSQNEASVSNVDLLDQLRQLGELRDKGLLTLEEFEIQKKKILNR